MSRVIGVLAALPGELAPLVRRWPRVTTSGKVRIWRQTSGRDDYIGVCAGMGSAAVTRAFAALRECATPTSVLSVGWAGALTPELRPGSVCRPEVVIDEGTGERFGRGGMSTSLVTLDRVADLHEKQRLRRAYPMAAAVDMEAATLARLSFAAGYEFHCIKAISDAADAVMPDLNPFVTNTGQFAMARFVAYVVPRPRYWATLVRFGQHAELAAHNLAQAIQQDLGVDLV